MKIQISASAAVSAKNLISSLTGSYHAGMQKVSTLNGREYLWNFVTITGSKARLVMTEAEAVGILCAGKLYKF